VRSTYHWLHDRRAAFEMNVLTNRCGLNQFEILSGIVASLNTTWTVQVDDHQSVDSHYRTNREIDKQ